MLFVLHNNEIYGLTTGQASATTRIGCGVKGTSGPTSMAPLNALQLALSVNPSFVARTYSGDIDHMTEMFKQGLQHKGFAMVEVFQACPTYNKATSPQWYRDRIQDVSELDSYDETDIWQARKAVEPMDDTINIGVLHRNSKAKSFIETQLQRTDALTTLVDEVKSYPIGDLY